MIYPIQPPEEESPNNNSLDEGFESTNGKDTSRDPFASYCSAKPDLPGYVSETHTGLCADVLGRGRRLDYCRVVSRLGDDKQPVDKFIACDIQSKGGFSYWFRSPSEAEGVQTGELQFIRRLGDDRFDSYCTVIPPDGKNPARAICYPVSGLGFSGAGEPDPNPPENIRVRLRTYENLLMWFPLVFPKGTQKIAFDIDQHNGAPRSSIAGESSNGANIISNKLTITPPVLLETADPKKQVGIFVAGGTPRLYSLKPFPMNEATAISMFIKPREKQFSLVDTSGNTSVIVSRKRPDTLKYDSLKRGSTEMLFFAGDDAYLNEIGLYITDEYKLGFRIFEGKAETFKAETGQIKTEKWNHILVQYKNGNWEFYINGFGAGKRPGAKHSFVKRSNGWIGTALPAHADESFMGEIADVRLYSRAIDKVGIEAIIYDFENNLLVSK
jgi:hypothetical protein